jgi:hypothetical protein
MDEARFSIELEKPQAPLNLVATMAAVARTAGRGPLAQAADLVRLRLGPGKLEMEEYCAFALFDRARFSKEEAARFAGRRRQAEDARLVNDQAWYMLGQDKLAAGALLEGLGLPVPRLQAILQRDLAAPGLTVLHTREDLAAYLRDGITYPFFSKPVGGSFSLGIVGVLSRDAGSDRLRLADGRDVAVDAYVAALFEAYEGGPRYHVKGFLFQEMLRPHPELETLCGTSALSTLRVVLLIEDGVPRLYRVAWKIPAAGNQADNYWRSGNLLAPVDLESGIAGRPSRGFGLEMERLDQHPDTGAAVTGFAVPDWRALVDLACLATHAFPGMTMQAWDIAPTDKGPYLIEVNGLGDYTLPQIAHGKGLLDEELLAFQRRAVKRKLR